MSKLTHADSPHAFQTEVLESTQPVVVDANPTIARRYSIQGIPTIALFRDGELAATTVGAKPRAAIESDLGIASTLGRTA